MELTYSQHTWVSYTPTPTGIELLDLLDILCFYHLTFVSVFCLAFHNFIRYLKGVSMIRFYEIVI